MTVADQAIMPPGRKGGDHPMTARKQAGNALVAMISQAEIYARGHRVMYDSPIGDDGVLGPAFTSILSGLLQLLNGELGGLDGGTLDREIRRIARDNNIEEIEL